MGKFQELGEGHCKRAAVGGGRRGGGGSARVRVNVAA